MTKQEYLNKRAVLLEELECRGIEIAEQSFPFIEETWNEWSDEKMWQYQIEEMQRVLKMVEDW